MAGGPAKLAIALGGLILAGCGQPGPSATAKAEAPRAARQFNLDCRGQLTRNELPSGRREAEAFHIVVRVDLDRRTFCMWDCEGIYHLSKIEAGRLEHHYDLAVKDEDHQANRYRDSAPSTAGPLDQKDDISIDLASGRFVRDYRYLYGDPAAFGYVDHYEGTCAKAPFSGIPVVNQAP